MIRKDGASQAGASQPPTPLLKDGVKAAKSQDSDKAPMQAGETQAATAIKAGATKDGDSSENTADR